MSNLITAKFLLDYVDTGFDAPKVENILGEVL